MTLTKVKLGSLIELCEEKNKNNIFTLDDVKGISIQKKFIETKADMEGVSLKPYLLVKPDSFAYVTVTSRNGNKITLAHNTTKDTYIVSSSYVVFRVKKTDLLDSDYLFMYFNRPEFDRYSRFNSWGSARETFSWEDMCDIDFELPPIEIQRKYVAIYKSMVANQKAYETGLEDLKLTCDGFLQELRKTNERFLLKDYIEQYKTINKESICKNCVGLYGNDVLKVESVRGENIKTYQIINHNSIVYPPPHFGKIGTIGIHKGVDAIISPMYVAFKVKKDATLNPDYLMQWFLRDEFKRYGDFRADNSVRDTFDFSMLCDYAIPIPDIRIQNSIASIFNVYKERKQINERLKNQIKDICPILIKGSIEEAKKAVI